MNYSKGKYTKEIMEIYLIDDKLLNKFLEKNNLKKEDLEDILEDSESENIGILSSLEEYIYSHISNIRIKSSLPKVFYPYIRTRKIGFDSPELISKRILTPKPPIYVSQQFLNNLAGVTNGRVLGAYDPNMDTIYLLDTLRGEEHDEVLMHENFHRDHPEWSEQQVRQATSRAGYNRFQGSYN